MADFLDEIKDAIGNAVADRTDKRRVGFDPAVCEGCPHRGDGRLRRCGLCGCPTLENFPLDKSGMVPEGCPRMAEHESRG